MEPSVIAIGALVISVLGFIGGARCMFGKKPWQALTYMSVALLGGAFGATVGVLALSFNAYRHLSGETYLLDLAIEQRAPQRFNVRLISRDAPARNFEIAGDEWLVEARILKWRPWAAALGFPALIRLERLGGRYIDINQEVTRGRTVYSLVTDSPPDVWQWATQAPMWLPGLDTVYGTATYLPLAHGARFAVLVTPSGLIARAVNSRAEQAVNLWRRDDGSPGAIF